MRESFATRCCYQVMHEIVRSHWCNCCIALDRLRQSLSAAQTRLKTLRLVAWQRSLSHAGGGPRRRADEGEDRPEHDPGAVQRHERGERDARGRDRAAQREDEATQSRFERRFGKVGSSSSAGEVIVAAAYAVRRRLSCFEKHQKYTPAMILKYPSSLFCGKYIDPTVKIRLLNDC